MVYKLESFHGFSAEPLVWSWESNPVLMGLCSDEVVYEVVDEEPMFTVGNRSWDSDLG